MYVLDNYFPLIVCVVFYAVVFLFAEITRKIVEMFIKKGTLLYTFLIEFIATAQMCIIIKHYGPLGFFFAVFGLTMFGGIVNRGAFISPLKPIEAFIHGKISSEKFLLIMSAETIGGVSAFSFAKYLWYYSLNYSNDHLENFEHLPCAIIHKVPFIYAFLFEIFATFLLRFIIHRLPIAYCQQLVSFVIASFLSFALTYIGVPGLNPVVASSRMQGCPGLDLQWFIMMYWCCPVLGWLLAAQFDNKYILRTSKKGKKKN